MLDKLLKVIVQRLDTTAAAVIAKRKAIERERASGDARDHAGREFLNSEGYTTPLPKAAQNAQNEYARARRDFEKADLPGALSSAITMMVARERRNETAVALQAYLEAEALRQTEGVHPEVKPHFARMFAMGIEPRMLPYVREMTLAIVCDVIMWDGHDPDMLDPASPMTAIFDLYASRLIVKPVHSGHRSRSRPDGADKEAERIRPDCYIFDKLAPTVPDEIVNEDDNTAAFEDEQPQVSTVAAVDTQREAAVEAFAPVFPIVLGDPDKPLVADVDAPMSPQYAQRVAESVYEKNPYKMSVYWPKDIERGEFHDSRLIPALERWVASDDNWTGAEQFLTAARRGEARTFIDEKRRNGISLLASRLVSGDQGALDEAKRLGVLD